MENLVPLGTGNSRLMKSNIPSNTTLAQLIQMWNNGTFPYDIGPLNSAGISQQGTPLNKDTLLKDTTAQAYGLGAEAVPDDVLAKLAEAAFVEDGAVTDIDGNIVAPQIATGSYVGTGTWGQSNPNTLTFPFTPKLWGLTGMAALRDGQYRYTDQMILIPWGFQGPIALIGTDDATASYSGNTVSYYSIRANDQANNLEYIYYYVAIGTVWGGGVTEPPEEAPINFVGGMGVGGVPIVIDKSKILITPVNDRYTVTIQKSALYMQQATNNAYYSLLHTITGGGINTADGSSITTSQQFLNGYSQSSYQIDVYPNAGETPTITISATEIRTA